MNPRQRMAVGAGIVGFLAAFAVLKWQESRIEDRASMIPVVVAGEDIPSGALLRPGLLKVRDTPRLYVPPGALGSPEEAEGQYASAPFAAGEPILGNKVSSSGAWLSSRIPEGRRAFTLPLDEDSTPAGLIRPGDLADVLATFDLYQNEKELSNFTATLFQAVRILAVGADFGSAPRPAPEPGMLADLSGSRPRTVSLDVSPEQAEVLLFCLSNGRLTLSLRSPSDLDFQDVPTTTFEEILRRTGLSRAKISDLPRRPSVEIIRGTQKNP